MIFPRRVIYILLSVPLIFFLLSILYRSRTPSITPAALPEVQQPPSILSEQDFNGFGLRLRDSKMNPGDTMLRVRISDDQPVYRFHITSFSATSSGRIEVFLDASSSKPLQVIDLDPNMFVSDEVANFFTVQDVNFDGYGDIGVPHQGGALWASYTYWVFDPQTHMFMRNMLTDELEKLGFGSISFDKSKKRMITRAPIGAVGEIITTYQFHKNHLSPVEELRLENRLTEPLPGASTTSSVICLTTKKHWQGEKTVTSMRSTPGECVPPSLPGSS